MAPSPSIRPGSVRHGAHVPAAASLRHNDVIKDDDDDDKDDDAGDNGVKRLRRMTCSGGGLYVTTADVHDDNSLTSIRLVTGACQPIHQTAQT